MQYIRKNVWELGNDWADPILWYARGVKAMQARALDEPTSWRFYGAIHGFDSGIWTQHGYLSNADVLPDDAVQQNFWSQCQHGSWYFLPWHRGYLIAFEVNVRASVVKLGGPADWALPYWNYSKGNQFKLPPAFASPDWPDGKGNNPLFVQQRYGPGNDGDVFVPQSSINLKAMTETGFTGVANGGAHGFGGPQTGFSHDGSGTTFGHLESQPHNQVHVKVGGQNGQDSNFVGLMTDPDTAGLDPIFWLHHANIDRMWAVWNQNPPSNANPALPNWLKGPANTGERDFVMPMPDGSSWVYTPDDIKDLAALNPEFKYDYDDLTPVVPVVLETQRLLKLGMSAAALNEMKGTFAMTTGKRTELVGANQGLLKIAGTEVRTSVRLDEGVRNKVIASLAMDVAKPVPDRVFLNLENVRGRSDATSLRVYVGLPEGAKPSEHPELMADDIGLFGVRKASLADGPHAGQGLTIILEITDIVDSLQLGGALDVASLDVRIVPDNPVSEEAAITIGRVSIYRQGQ